MPKIGTALVVEDDDEWTKIFEETLSPDFTVEKAKSLADVRRVLADKGEIIRIALVDILLDESDKAKESGLDVMFILNKQGIPCIAATNYEDGKAIRDALVTGGAQDVWFKTHEKLVTLREKIDEVIQKANTKSGRHTNSFINPFFPPPGDEIDPMRAFLIMPFSEKWSDQTHAIVKSVAENHDLTVFRADGIFSSNNIIDDIWHSINQAGLIIADITVHNANVYYELGIAHTLGKETILIRQPNGDKPPLDIALWRYFEYELARATEFTDKLSKLFDSYLKKYKIGH